MIRGISVSLDVQKAFDSLSHEFIAEAMQDAGFSSQTPGMIRQAVQRQLRLIHRATSGMSHPRRYSSEFRWMTRGVLCASSTATPSVGLTCYWLRKGLPLNSTFSFTEPEPLSAHQIGDPSMHVQHQEVVDTCFPPSLNQDTDARLHAFRFHYMSGL